MATSIRLAQGSKWDVRVVKPVAAVPARDATPATDDSPAQPAFAGRPAREGTVKVKGTRGHDVLRDAGANVIGDVKAHAFGQDALAAFVRDAIADHDDAEALLAFIRAGGTATRQPVTAAVKRANAALSGALAARKYLVIRTTADAADDGDEPVVRL